MLFTAVVVVVAVVVVSSFGSEPTPDATPTTTPEPTPPAPDTDAIDRARAAAVAVTATGCGLDAVGSGVVVGDGVVTNAHVVAGSESVVVITPDNAELAARVVAFDPLRDLAYLEVEGLDAEPLGIAEPAGGRETIAIARSDETDEVVFEVIPLTISRTIRIFISDIYGDGRHERAGMELRGEIGPGDSGAGIVDGRGDLVGVVFSASRRDGDVAYGVSAVELESFISTTTGAPADTGPCL